MVTTPPLPFLQKVSPPVRLTTENCEALTLNGVKDSKYFDIFRPSLEFPADKSEIVKSKVSCADEAGKTKISEERSASSNKRELVIPKSEIVPIKLKNSYK